MAQRECRVKHLRLFGCRVEADTSVVRWLLHYADKYDAVEHVEVNIVAGEAHTDEYVKRDPYRMIPFLEVIFDGSKPYPPGLTTCVSDLAPWKADAPSCTLQTAEGKTIADPHDRVFTLTEGGAICAFLCEHFGINDMYRRESTFHRCRNFELIAQKEMLHRRILTMILIQTVTKSRGTTEEEIIIAIAAHERELLWTFRQFEDIFTARERAAATKAGLCYVELLAQGEREVADQENDEKIRATAMMMSTTSTSSTSTPAMTSSSSSSVSEIAQAARARKNDRAQKKKRQDEGKVEFTDNEEGHQVKLERDATSVTVNGAEATTSPPDSLKAFTSPTLVALDAYVSGATVSIIDLFMMFDLQILPLLQSWLPDSLRQRRFPAMLRFIARMKKVRGFDKAVKPSRSFLKLCRKYPNSLDKSPVLDFHTARVKQAVEAKQAADLRKQTQVKTDADGKAGASHAGTSVSRTDVHSFTSDPRLLPQQHFRALDAHFRSSQSQSDGQQQQLHAPAKVNTTSERIVTDSSARKKTQSRREKDRKQGDEVTPEKAEKEQITRGRAMDPALWAPRICVVPISSPCTLSLEDEMALVRSHRPRAKRSAQSADACHHPIAGDGGTLTGHPAAGQDLIPQGRPDASCAAENDAMVKADVRADVKEQRNSVDGSSFTADHPNTHDSTNAAPSPTTPEVEQSAEKSTTAGTSPASTVLAEKRRAAAIPARSQTAQPSDRRSVGDVSIVVPPRRTWRHHPYEWRHHPYRAPGDGIATEVNNSRGGGGGGVGGEVPAMMQPPLPPQLFKLEQSSTPLPSASAW